MRRIQDVTLDEAHELVKVNSFALWTVSGNYMNTDNLEKEEHVETRVFMGTTIFLLGLSVEKEGVQILASEVEFVDIWLSLKTKYPQLFKNEVKGEVLIFP